MIKENIGGFKFFVIYNYSLIIMSFCNYNCQNCVFCRGKSDYPFCRKSCRVCGHCMFSEDRFIPHGQGHFYYPYNGNNNDNEDKKHYIDNDGKVYRRQKHRRIKRRVTRPWWYKYYSPRYWYD